MTEFTRRETALLIVSCALLMFAVSWALSLGPGGLSIVLNAALLLVLMAVWFWHEERKKARLAALRRDEPGSRPRWVIGGRGPG